MKQKIKLMLLLTLVAVALTACACNGQTATPTPKPSAATTTPMPTSSATMEASPSPSASDALPDMSAEPSQSPAGTDMMIDVDALKMEVEKLSEVDTSDVVAYGDKAIVGLSFDTQYQGTLTDRIEEMVMEKITAKEAGLTNVAVTADPTLCTEIKTLAEEVKGMTMTTEQQTKFDELYQKIKPSAAESPAA